MKPFETHGVETLRVTVAAGPDAGLSAESSGRLSIGTADGNDLILSDCTVSRYHAEFQPTPEGVRVRDLGSTNGTHCGAVKIAVAVVPFGSQIRFGESTIRIDGAEQQNIEVFNGSSLAGIVGRSVAMRRLMAHVQRAAGTTVSVLLVGESGTGKEVIARAIHDIGARCDKPYVVVDCGSLAPNLISSELFGHERGAFTGADRQHIGAFERASGGTLFLDEVGELPPELQVNLLGVLERQRFRRVGGTSEINVDVRIIAATNRDLRSEVNANRFRLDLYYRLAVVRMSIPPLRERIDDIEILAEHFAARLGEERSFEELFPGSLADVVRGHPWPGNVRELRNIVEATVAMGSPPAFEEAQSDSSTGSFGPHLKQPFKEAKRALIESFERTYLTRVLSESDGNVSAASRRAGLDRSHFFSLIRKHGLR